MEPNPSFRNPVNPIVKKDRPLALRQDKAFRLDVMEPAKTTSLQDLEQCPRPEIQILTSLVRTEIAVWIQQQRRIVGIF